MFRKMGPPRFAKDWIMNVPADDHDSPWKEALEIFFAQAMALLAPALHQVIDWSYSPQFLDKELQAFVRPRRGGNSGRRVVDKLVRVRLLDGAVAWLLVHIEVQGQSGGPAGLRHFAARMYEYRYLIHASSNAPTIYSLGILVDSRAGPTHLVFSDEYLGQGTKFSFPVVHLAQWLDRWDELEAWAPHNPFAVVVMAQLQALRHPDKETRLVPLVALVRRLYSYGYGRDAVQQLLRLIEWMMRLPVELEPVYFRAVEQLEQEKRMSYVTIAERLGMQRGLDKGMEEGLQKGLQKGLQEGLQKGLQKGLEEGRAEGRSKGQADLLLRQMERRFGPLPDAILQRVHTADAGQLEQWALNILDAASLDAVFRD